MSAFAIDFPGKVREIATNVAFSPAFSAVDVQQDAVVCRAFWDTGANGSRELRRSLRHMRLRGDFMSIFSTYNPQQEVPDRKTILTHTI